MHYISETKGEERKVKGTYQSVREQNEQKERTPSDEGGVCVYHAGVCQQGRAAERSLASVHFY